MTTLSLGMIVKNEAETIERVLGAARTFCDELIIVDTGSTDETMALAEGMGAQVHHFTWIDDFAAARNHAFSLCTGDWLMWLDADDEITPENQARFLELKQTVLNDDLDAVMATYEYAPQYRALRERLVRREAGFRWEYAIHECIPITSSKSLVRHDIVVHHKPLPEKGILKVDRNISILEKELAKGNRSARMLYYYGNELRDHKRFAEALAAYQEYLPLSTLKWEKYQALMSCGRCCEGIDKPDEALDWYTKATLLDSTRAEAYMRIGTYYYHQKAWAEAIPFFSTATLLTRPASGFISEADYSWLPYDYLSICYSNLGQYAKSVEFILKALPGNPDKTRLIKNMHWLADKL